MLRLTNVQKNYDDDLIRSFFGNSFLDELMYENKGIMKTDILNNENEVTLTINMPGYKKEEIEISFEDNTLTVKANKKEEKNDCKKYVLRERVCGSVSRAYYLGEDIDNDTIVANLENGVLVINAKKVKKPIKNIVIG